MKKLPLRVLLPLLVLLGLGVFLGIGLTKDPRKLPSALLGKSVPAFDLPVLAVPTVHPVPGELSVSVPTDQRIKTQDLQGQVWVLNVFASWCQACLVEHRHLLELSRQGNIRLVGLAYKDELDDTRRWLAQHGNPYHLILVDQKGLTGIDLGVYGVPETFLMSANNTIVHKHVGPVPDDTLNSLVRPRLPGALP